MLNLWNKFNWAGRFCQIQLPAVWRRADNPLQTVQSFVKSVQMRKVRIRRALNKNTTAARACKAVYSALILNGEKMGNVAVALKVMPASAEEDLEKIRQEIAKKVKIQDYKIEPIAFGLKALKILVVVPDSEQDVEEKIKSVSGVGEIEVESATLI